MKPSQLTLVMVSMLTVACGDPYIQDQIDALGDEAPGFDPPTEIHRPGSPCVLCHSKKGGAEPELSLGGTLFFELTGAPPFPAAGYQVSILDSEGNTRLIPSNPCGNFWVAKADYDPAYPIKVTTLGPDPADPGRFLSNNSMTSRVGRDGSCAACHKHPKSPLSPGVVVVSPPSGETPVPPSACPPNNFAPQLSTPLE